MSMVNSPAQFRCTQLSPPSRVNLVESAEVSPESKQTNNRNVMIPNL